MADRQEKRRNTYTANGSAAYDAYTQNGARRLRELPKERKRPEYLQRIKGRLAISPVAAIGGVLTAVMMVMVIFGYVRLYEAKSRLGTMRSEVELLQESNIKLRSVYESGIDLNTIEQRALELGMQKPTVNQIVYVDVAVPDHAQITVREKTNWLQDAVHAIKDSFRSLVEYFF